MIIETCFTTIALSKSITITVLFLTYIFVRELNSGFVSLSGNEECPCTFKCTSSPFLFPAIETLPKLILAHSTTASSALATLPQLILAHSTTASQNLQIKHSTRLRSSHQDVFQVRDSSTARHPIQSGFFLTSAQHAIRVDPGA